MISAVMKCHILDESLLRMTQEAVDTVKPYVKELILIDHASPFGGGWMRSVADVYVRNKEALGSPKTVEQGIKLASTEHVAVLNNDIKFFGDWVSPLMKYDKYALIHPMMLDWDQPITQGNRVLINLPPEQGMFFSAFILDRGVYDKLGGWDTDYDFWGYDDWDYYYRLLRRGYEAVWTDEVVYWHKGGATIERIGRDRYKDKNRKLFKKKHGVDPHDVIWQ